MAGLEVEEQYSVAPPFSQVVVAEILSAEQHPDADRLRVCKVNAGTGSELQIVCGAPNARVGIKIPCALVGALLPPAEEGGKPNKLYMSIVGSLLYAAMVTRPDITYAVQALGRHLQASGNEHMIAAKRVLRYLQGTKDLGIVYEDSGMQDISIIGYSDADWGGDQDTRRSTTGYVFMLNTGVVSWASKLQPTIALSSAEAEYMAACAAVQEAIHLREFMSNIGYPQREATTIFEDNQGCIALSGNPIFHKRTKHIDIRYHFIRERIVSKEVELKYIPTNNKKKTAQKITRTC
jgi:hypothetical protein